MKISSMEDTIIFYFIEDHLNTTLELAHFITKNHPSISVTLISTVPDSSVLTTPPITYHRLPSITLPSDLPTNPTERFFEIPRLYTSYLREALQEISKKSRISAFMIDFFCNSAFQVSTSLEIPTYFYLSVGAFGLCVFLYMPTIHHTIPQNLVEFNNFIEVPGGTPLHSSDFPEDQHVRKSKSYENFLDVARNMRKARGILVNAFDALEYRAKEALVNGLCIPDGPTPPVYFVAPLLSETVSTKKVVEEHDCLRWLELQPRKSVIFLCFGRRGFFSAKQLCEMAIGLENSGHRFLWSIRNPPEYRINEDPDLDNLLPEGFLERTKDRGFIIKSWAPQKEVLSHEAIGGFVTHCGRSSIMEAVWFGVPMIAWPIYAEQRMNRVTLVKDMQLGIQLEESKDGFVKAEELEGRVKELMGSDTGRAMRSRVKEMKVAAHASIREGGSTIVALRKFVEAVFDQRVV